MGVTEFFCPKIRAANPQVKSGDPLKIGVSFTDPQGDITNVNYGVLGQSTHSSLPASRVGIKTSGTLFLDLKPNAWEPGQYTLVVSMTETAGRISASITLPFAILDPRGNVPPQTDAVVSVVDVLSVSKDTSTSLPEASTLPSDTSPQVDVVRDTSSILVDPAQDGITADGAADTGTPGDAPCAVTGNFVNLGEVRNKTTARFAKGPVTPRMGKVP